MNIAEYKVVLLGLCKLRAMGVQNYILKLDSKVIASQIEKECMTSDATLEKYLAIVQRMENYFKGFTVKYVERTKKTEANELAKPAARRKNTTPIHVIPNHRRPLVKTVELEPTIVNIIQGED
jgi:ribonuclease HI